VKVQTTYFILFSLYIFIACTSSNKASTASNDASTATIFQFEAGSLDTTNENSLSTVSVRGDGATQPNETETDASAGPISGDATVSALRDAAKIATDAGVSTEDTAVPVEEAGNLTQDARAADAPATEEPKCSPSASGLDVGNTVGTLVHDGRERTYLVYVPEGTDQTNPVPVVMDFHGFLLNGAGQAAFSGWNVLADREKFIVVYPDGIEASWNVDDTCCGTAGSEKVDDVGFVRALIEQLVEQTCVDRKRVYASGLSNGGGFAHRLGCDAADVIAAIAPVATDLRTQPCSPQRPISVMAFRGMSDSLEPYEGGVVGPPGGQYTSPGAKGSLELWRTIDQCTGSPTVIDQYCESYTECAEGVEADLCSLPNVDHIPYNNALNFSIIETAWKMFMRQPMK